MPKNAQPVSIEGNMLVIRMPLSKGTPSKTGKSLVLATTGGFAEIPGSDARLNLTVIKKI